jgi:hypothetical protein
MLLTTTELTQNASLHRFLLTSIMSGERELTNENPSVARDKFLEVREALIQMESSHGENTNEKEQVANKGLCEHRLGMANLMLREVRDALTSQMPRESKAVHYVLKNGFSLVPGEGPTRCYCPYPTLPHLPFAELITKVMLRCYTGHELYRRQRRWPTTRLLWRLVLKLESVHPNFIEKCWLRSQTVGRAPSTTPPKRLPTALYWYE